jgi:hypothetical protein
MLEHPENVKEWCGGGCVGCPSDYNYMADPEDCEGGGKDFEECTACWDREIPGAKPTTTTTIKDSGQRTTFGTGAVRDMHTGKGRMDLLPWEAIIEVSKHCEEGALKYGERNCEKGIPIHSLIDSAFRHLAKYTMGEKDEPHLRAAAWNVLFALYMEIRHPELQDIPSRVDASNWDDKAESGLLE